MDLLLPEDKSTWHCLGLEWVVCSCGWRALQDVIPEVYVCLMLFHTLGKWLLPASLATFRSFCLPTDFVIFHVPFSSSDEKLHTAAGAA